MLIFEHTDAGRPVRMQPCLKRGEEAISLAEAALNGLDLRQLLKISPRQLRCRVDPQTLPFESTTEVHPLVGTVG